MTRCTHLCVHSHYSLLGGTTPVETLVARAVQDGMPALALTDTNAMYGALSFARACRKAEIQPLIGLRLTLAPPALDGFDGPLSRTPGSLVLLARDNFGYRSLCHLSSLLQAAPDRDLRTAHGLDLKDLQAHRKGLICLSGGRFGWLDRALHLGRERAAYRFITRLAMIYGSENLVLNLEIHKPEDIPTAREIQALGKRLGLQTAAVLPVHCMMPEDKSMLRLLAAIQHNCKIHQLPWEALPDGGDASIGLHWLTPHEMQRRFRSFPRALAQTVQISARCEDPLPKKKTLWPTIDLPKNQSADDRLAEISHQGMRRNYGSQPEEHIRDRLEKELTVIAEFGFAPLFLIVADIVRFARQADIPVSSRGSVANSLAAYCAAITTVDPIAHDLLFERFLSPGRPDMPDIDLDFCSRRRDEILAYVHQTYGAEHVSLIGTINTMRLRSAVRETAKAYGLPPQEINQLVTSLPRHRHPRARQMESSTIQEIIDSLSNPLHKEIIDQASRLVGLPHHMGVHPGGVVITPIPLKDILPLQWTAKGFLITQYDFRSIESLGLPKLDLLGISALTVLSDAEAWVKQHHDPGFNLSNIPQDDPRTAAMLREGDTVGVFQCDSQGARATLRKLKAGSIRDLAVANAFFKPGPSTGGMAGSFTRRFRGDEEVRYLHPALKPILGPTKGVLIFQEQILRVATEIAGLDWEQAGCLRRGMSKMKSGEMAPIESGFIAGCQRPPPTGPGFSEAQARQLWEQVESFSGYGFNQGHATAYAAVSYQMAYLKAHWPGAYFCARLANHGGYHHPAVYMVEAMRLGMEIRPPHINHSLAAFSLDEQFETQVLWMGLDAVHSLRRSVIEDIIRQRLRIPFSSLRDLTGRVELQEKEVSNLIRCGALDGLSESRSALLVEQEDIQHAGNVLQLPLFSSTAAPDASVETEDTAQRAAWELQILDYPISNLHSPLENLAGHHPDWLPIQELEEHPGEHLMTAGIRIPGWTRGEGFFLWDGVAWVITRLKDDIPMPDCWQPLAVSGRLRADEWGSNWFEIEKLDAIP